MAYFRGKTYIYSSGDQLHIWVHDGADGWEETQWAADYDEENDAYIRHPGYESAAAVAIPEATINSFVMMRFAQLVAHGKALDVLEQALADSGNFGSVALQNHADELRETILDLTRAIENKISPNP